MDGTSQNGRKSKRQLEFTVLAVDVPFDLSYSSFDRLALSGVDTS